jgi:hypothetical protein
MPYVAVVKQAMPRPRSRARVEENVHGVGGRGDRQRPRASAEDPCPIIEAFERRRRPAIAATAIQGAATRPNDVVA